MKISVLLTAAALAVGGNAWAQQPPQQKESLGQKADRQFDRAENATSRAVNGAPGEPSLGQKAGRVFDRMEDGTKRAWNKVTGKSRNAAQADRVESSSDTRAMGAGPAPSQNAQGGSDRQARMDAAYRNYQSKQQR